MRRKQLSKSSGNEPISSVSDVVYASENVEESISLEEHQIAVFTAKIRVALKANDANSFAKLIATNHFNVVTVYGGEGVVYKVAHQNKWGMVSRFLF